MSFWQTLAHGATFSVSLPPVVVWPAMAGAFVLVALLRQLPGGGK